MFYLFIQMGHMLRLEAHELGVDIGVVIRAFPRCPLCSVILCLLPLPHFFPFAVLCYLFWVGVKGAYCRTPSPYCFIFAEDYSSHEGEENAAPVSS